MGFNWSINSKGNAAEQEAAADYLFHYPTNKDGTKTDYAHLHINYVHDALKAHVKDYTDFIQSVVETIHKRRSIQKYCITVGDGKKRGQMECLAEYFSDPKNAGKLSDLYRHCHDKLTTLEKRAGSTEAQKLAEDKSPVELAQMYLDMKDKYIEAERDRKQLLSENIRLNNKGKGNDLNKTYFK